MIDIHWANAVEVPQCCHQNAAIEMLVAEIWRILFRRWRFFPKSYKILLRRDFRTFFLSTSRHVIDFSHFKGDQISIIQDLHFYPFFFFIGDWFISHCISDRLFSAMYNTRYRFDSLTFHWPKREKKKLIETFLIPYAQDHLKKKDMASFFPEILGLVVSRILFPPYHESCDQAPWPEIVYFQSDRYQI